MSRQASTHLQAKQSNNCSKPNIMERIRGLCRCLWPCPDNPITVGAHQDRIGQRRAGARGRREATKIASGGAICKNKRFFFASWRVRCRTNRCAQPFFWKVSIRWKGYCIGWAFATGTYFGGECRRSSFPELGTLLGSGFLVADLNQKNLVSIQAKERHTQTEVSGTRARNASNACNLC